MQQPIPGRAHTPEQKRQIIERLYIAWLKNPTLRLAQFIYVATDGRDIFSIEDEALVTELEQMRKKMDSVSRKEQQS